MTATEFRPGTLVTARGREWLVLPGSPASPDAAMSANHRAVMLHKQLTRTLCRRISRYISGTAGMDHES
jgi:hypothetical protein